MLKEVNEVTERLILKKKNIDSGSSMIESAVLSVKKEGEDQAKQVNDHFADLIKAAEVRRNELLSLISQSVQTSVGQLENQNQKLKKFSGEVSGALDQIKAWSSQSDHSLLAKDHPSLLSEIEDVAGQDELIVPKPGSRSRPQLDGSLITIVQSHGSLVPTMATLEAQLASLAQGIETEAKEGAPLVPGFETSLSFTCEAHPSQPLDHMCLEEGEHEMELVCALCISTGDHKGHKSSSVAEVQPNLVQSLQEKMQTLQGSREKLLDTTKKFLTAVNQSNKELEATSASISNLSSLHKEIANKKGDLTSSLTRSLDLEREKISKVLSSCQIRAQNLLNGLQAGQALANEKDPLKFAVGFRSFKSNHCTATLADLQSWSNSGLQKKLEAINGRLGRVSVNPTTVTLDDLTYTSVVQSDIPVGFPETLYSGCVLVPSKREIWSISYHNYGKLTILHLEKKEVVEIDLPFAFQCSAPVYDGKEHVYVHEGCFDSQSKIVRVHIHTRAIEELPPSPKPFSYYGTCCIQGRKLWVRVETTLMSLDLDSKTWQDEAATLPEYSMLLATPSQPDHIYVLVYKGALHRLTISTQVLEQISTKPGKFIWNGDGTRALLLPSGVLVSEGAEEGAEGGWEAYSIQENRWISLQWPLKEPAFMGGNFVYDQATKSFYIQTRNEEKYDVVRL